jgi:CheY-like chemotaxis protein
MNILVADDTGIQRRHAKEIFTNLGFNAICVKDGLQAIQHLKTEGDSIGQKRRRCRGLYTRQFCQHGATMGCNSSLV